MSEEHHISQKEEDTEEDLLEDEEEEDIPMTSQFPVEPYTSKYPFETSGEEAICKELAEIFATGNEEQIMRRMRELESSWPGLFRSENGKKIPSHALQPALSKAVSAGKLETTSLLLEYGFTVDDEAVVAAIESQGLRFLDLFLKHGWSVNRIDYRGGGPPHLGTAASTNNSEAVAWFLSKGADANLHGRAPNDHTPLSIAAIKASPHILEMLLKAGGDPRKDSSLHHTIRNSSSQYRVANVQLLLQAGAPINALECASTPRLFKIWSESGRKILGTPLHVAVERKDAQMVKILLEHGADLAVNNTAGLTPLMLAKETGDHTVIDLLT